MTLSIIIVHYRTKGLLKQCLRGLLAAQIAVDHEIIVVDNFSNDGTAEMMSELFPTVRFIQNPKNDGFGRANNAAMSVAQGEYFMIMNADTCTFPGEIEKMIAYLETNPKIGVLGPRLLNPDRLVQVSCYRFYRWFTPIVRRTVLRNFSFGRRELERFLMLDFDHSTIRDVDWLMGSLLLVPACRVKEIGGFDERFFMYFEDVDWCRRFWNAGYRVVYYPLATFVHYHARDSNAGSIIASLRRRTTRYHIHSWLEYFWKWRQQPLPNSRVDD